MATESTLSVAARRMRGQRRIAQRTGENRSNGTPPTAIAQLTSSVAIVVGLTVGLLALLLRLAPAPAPIVEELAAEAPTYTPDGLRPALSAPEDTPIAMPASYLVEEGDTLLSVSYRFGSAVEAIRLASNLPDADVLEIGQVLVVPPAWSMLRDIDPSSTLSDLAEAFGLTVEMAAVYNGLSTEFADAEIGRNVVVVPPTLGSGSHNMTLTARDAEIGLQVAFADEIERPGEIAVYTVADGDTILDIANRMGVDPDALVSVNRLSDSDWIVAGDQLAVPLWARPAQGGEAPAMDESVGVSLTAEAMLAAVPRTPVTYEVAPGDTIGALAERFGVDADTIVTTNDLISADRIKIGQELTILPVSGLIYSVRPGDTLADIAATFKVDLGPIIDFNYLEDADFISVGKELIIPGARPLPPPRPATPTVYEVQPGDTISTIALRFGVTAADIVAANGLRSADRIAIGDKLTIKAGAGGSSGASSAASQQTVTRNLPVPAAPASSTAARQSTPGAGGSISSIAMQFQGSRYVFGGTTPSGFDCSGFVYYVVNRSGKSLSRGMWGQYNAGFHPGRGELQPGDIVFFQNTYMAGLSHNGIYIGGGQFIHASDERSGVKISSLSESYWASRWFGATRVW